MDAYRPRKRHPLLDRKNHKVSSPPVERPAWDDSQHNLSIYSLSLEEQIRRKLSVISHNNIAAPQELRRKLGNEIIVLEGTDGKVALGVIEEPKSSTFSAVSTFSPSSSTVMQAASSPLNPPPSSYGGNYPSPVGSDPSLSMLQHHPSNVSYVSSVSSYGNGYHKASPSLHNHSGYISGLSPIHTSPVSRSSVSPTIASSSFVHPQHGSTRTTTNDHPQPWNIQRKFDEQLNALRAKVNSTRSQHTLSRLQQTDHSTSPVAGEKEKSTEEYVTGDTETLNYTQSTDRPLAITDLQTTIVPVPSASSSGSTSMNNSKATFQSPMKSNIKSYRYNINPSSSSTFSSSSSSLRSSVSPNDPTASSASSVPVTTPVHPPTSPSTTRSTTRFQRTSSLSPVNKENDYPYLTPVIPSRPMNRSSPLMERSDSGNQSPSNNVSPVQPVTCQTTTTVSNHSPATTPSQETTNSSAFVHTRSTVSLNNAQRFTPSDLQDHVHHHPSSSSSSSSTSSSPIHTTHQNHRHYASLPSSNQSVLSSHSFTSSARKLSSRYPPLRTPVGTASVVSTDSHPYASSPQPHRRASRSPDSGSIVSDRRSLSPSQTGTAPSVRIITVPESLKSIVRSLGKSLDPEGDAATAMARARPVDHEEEHDTSYHTDSERGSYTNKVLSSSIRSNQITKSVFQSPYSSRQQYRSLSSDTVASVGQRITFSSPSAPSLPVVTEEPNDFHDGPNDMHTKNRKTDPDDTENDANKDEDDLSMKNLHKEMQLRATMEARRRLQLEGYTLTDIAKETGPNENEATVTHATDNLSIASDDTDLLLAGPDAYIQHKENRRTKTETDPSVALRSSLRSSTASLMVAEIVVDRALDAIVNDTWHGTTTSTVDKEEDTVAHILAKYEQRLAALDTHKGKKGASTADKMEPDEPVWKDEVARSFDVENGHGKDSAEVTKDAGTLPQPVPEPLPKDKVQRKLSFTNDFVSSFSRVRFSLPPAETMMEMGKETTMEETEELSLPSFSSRIMLPDEHPSLIATNALRNSISSGDNNDSSSTGTKFLPLPIPMNPLVFDGNGFRVSQEFRNSLTVTPQKDSNAGNDNLSVRNSTSTSTEESPTLLAASFTYRHMQGGLNGSTNGNTVEDEEEPTSIYAYVPGSTSSTMERSTTVPTAAVPSVASAWLPSSIVPPSNSTVSSIPNPPIASKIRWVSRSPRANKPPSVGSPRTMHTMNNDTTNNTTPLPPSVFSSLAHVFTSPTMNMGTTPLTPNVTTNNSSSNGFAPMSAVQPPIWKNSTTTTMTHNGIFPSTHATSAMMSTVPPPVNLDFSPSGSNFLKLSTEPYPSHQPSLSNVPPSAYRVPSYDSSLSHHQHYNVPSMDIRSLSIHQLFVPSQGKGNNDENNDYTTKRNSSSSGTTDSPTAKDYQVIARNLTEKFQEVATVSSSSSTAPMMEDTHGIGKDHGDDTNNDGMEEATPLPRSFLPSPMVSSSSFSRTRGIIKVERTPPPSSSSSSSVPILQPPFTRAWFNSPLH